MEARLSRCAAREAGGEGEQDRAGEAEAPVADGRENHRHAGVVEAAQHAGGHRLDAVDQLKQGGEHQERSREGEGLGGRWMRRDREAPIGRSGRPTIAEAVTAMQSTTRP